MQSYHCFSFFVGSKRESHLRNLLISVRQTAFDLLIFPIILTRHWTLAVIDQRHNTIEYFDSLGGENKKCLDLLQGFLYEAYEALGKQIQEFTQITVQVSIKLYFIKNRLVTIAIALTHLLD